MSDGPLFDRLVEPPAPPPPPERAPSTELVDGDVYQRVLRRLSAVARGEKRK